VFWIHDEHQIDTRLPALIAPGTRLKAAPISGWREAGLGSLGLEPPELDALGPRESLAVAWLAVAWLAVAWLTVAWLALGWLAAGLMAPGLTAPTPVGPLAEWRWFLVWRREAFFQPRNGRCKAMQSPGR
jgi:hypothetical protein